MQYATKDLIGPHLDLAVALAEGRQARIMRDVHSSDFRSKQDICQIAPFHGYDKRASDWIFYRPSTDPKDGWPLIDRWKISLHARNAGGWIAQRYTEEAGRSSPFNGEGPTPGIAVARAFVTSVSGYIVELPE